MKKKWEALYQMMNHLAEVGPNHYNHTLVAALCMRQRDEIKAAEKKREIERLSRQLLRNMASAEAVAAQ